MKKYGSLITVLVVALILFGFFHEIFLNANKVSFAKDGDGLKSTFGTVYHIKHDSSYWHTDAMNYPFGESVFFTGNQVVLTNTLKLIKDAGWDLSDYALGISNLLILLSYVIASLFIYMIFRELDVSWWFSSLAAVIIVILSNQWERLGGHYNLAYAYLIPVVLYLLLLFYKKPSYLISVIIGVLVILFSAKQLYIAAFILILWVPFWFFLPFHNKEKFGKPTFIIAHIFIQFLVPFFLFNLFTGMHDPGLDRTAYPWGFYPSRVRLDAVFLPEGFPHGGLFNFKGPIRMEAYVGALGTVVALIIMGSTLLKLVGKKGWNALAVAENPAWSLLFWAGVISLLIGLGIPFSPNWEGLLNHAGPFRQLRAVGRFVFPFYYVMTITSFYYLWRFQKTSTWKVKPYLLAFVFLFMAYESYFHIHKRPAMYTNPITWHSDRYNKTPELAWIEEIEPSDFQAMIPLPFFHVGSENYWMGDRSPVQALAYASSVKSGLPLTAVMLSRTSITQTLMGLDLVGEPYHTFPVLEELPDQRPFVLLCHKKGGFTVHEKRLISKAELIAENKEARIYSLEVDSIRSLIPDRKAELLGVAGKDNLDQTRILFEDFSSQPEGCFASEFQNSVTFFEQILPDTGKYLVSFWFEGVDRDLWPRTNFWTDLYREDGSKYFYNYTDFFRKMVLRDETWGLIEYPIHVKEQASTLKISMRNKVITGGEMKIDRILVQPEGSVHLVKDTGSIWVNNRELLPTWK